MTLPSAEEPPVTRPGSQSRKTVRQKSGHVGRITTRHEQGRHQSNKVHRLPHQPAAKATAALKSPKPSTTSPAFARSFARNRRHRRALLRQQALVRLLELEILAGDVERGQNGQPRHVQTRVAAAIWRIVSST